MYISSIIHKYGDNLNIKKDAENLADIFSRQGAQFLIDSLAEHYGNIVVKFKIPPNEAIVGRDSLVNALKDAISERI